MYFVLYALFYSKNYSKEHQNKSINHVNHSQKFWVFWISWGVTGNDYNKCRLSANWLTSVLCKLLSQTRCWVSTLRSKLIHQCVPIWVKKASIHTHWCYYPALYLSYTILEQRGIPAHRPITDQKMVKIIKNWQSWKSHFNAHSVQWPLKV